MKKLLTCILSIFLTASIVAENAINNPGKAPSNLGRPSVALVLSGGGINGCAEIPILEELEQLGIPVDIILGTSVGAIVGGLYSAGYTTEQLHTLFVTQNWPEIFADFTPSVYESLYNEHGRNKNLLPVNFGTDLKLQTGIGISNGQKAYQMLKQLTIKIPSDVDFDSLDIPFRAVCTDMQKGVPYLFRSGDMAEVIRGSMTVAGLFEPLEIEGTYFLDGGLSLNLPVNIAKKMGYDIIIAVEIAPAIDKPVREYEVLPTLALENSIYSPMRSMDRQYYSMADLVIEPDMTEFDIADFFKAEEIYLKGKEAVEKHHNDFVKLRDKIFGNKKTAAGIKEDSYASKAFLKIQDIKITDAYSEDFSYLEKKLRQFKGFLFTEEIQTEINNIIYKTGHYKAVRTRLNDQKTLEVYLSKYPEKNFRILLGTNLSQGITAGGGASYTNVNFALQLKGATTLDSLLSFKATVMNDWEASLLYFQPLGKNFYISLDSDYKLEEYKHLSYQHWYNNLSAGINYLDIFDFKTSAFYKLALTSEQYKWYSGLNGFIKLNLLDKPCFYEKGFYLDSAVNYIVSDFDFSSPILTGEANIKAALPAGKFAVKVSATGGYDFTKRLIENSCIMTTEGFSNYDKLYFPHLFVKNVFGDYKYAGSLTLQYRIIDSLTIAGGTMFLFVNGTYGNISSFNNGVWSCSTGTGIRMLDGCNLLIRIGAANSPVEENKIRPFATLDFGAITF